MYIVVTTLSIAAIASGITFGAGMDAGLKLLLGLMATDYIMGLGIAIFCKRSPKTRSGRLSSKKALAGLFKKCTMLTFVLLGALSDEYLGQAFIADAMIVSFIVSEFLSVVENAALMGIPVPIVVRDMLDTLNKRRNSGHKTIKEESDETDKQGHAPTR